MIIIRESRSKPFIYNIHNLCRQEMEETELLATETTPAQVTGFKNNGSLKQAVKLWSPTNRPLFHKSRGV